MLNISINKISLKCLPHLPVANELSVFWRNMYMPPALPVHAIRSSTVAMSI